MRTSPRPAFILAGLLICIGLITFRAQVRRVIGLAASPLHRLVTHEHTIASRVRQYGEAVRQRLEPDFRRANIAYPPHAFTLLAFKHEKVLELHAAGADGKFQYVRTYPILAASGRSGPKLREGDYQVPEGFYRVESLNPNSLYHLALRVNYPNEFDRTKGAAEHRENLGGDIMIHGSAASIGCLAMGDVAAEDLFVLAANTGIKNIRIVISPSDFRDRASLPVGSGSPVWLEDLYMRIKTELGKYPRPKSAGPLPQPGKMGLT